MKIYVWDGALAAYYGGLIVVVAPSLRAAKEAVRKERAGFGSQAALEQDLMSKPKVIRITDTMRPRVWACDGGE